MQDLITRYAWGEIWSQGRARPAHTQLHHADRAGRARPRGEAGLHVRAALRIGLSPDEIEEVLLHSAIYCGVPAANGAFASRDAYSTSTSAPADAGTLAIIGAQTTGLALA